MALPAVLLGSADVALTDGVLRLPDAFAAAFVGGLVVTAWLDGCIALWPRAEWDDLAARLVRLPVGDLAARSYARLLFSSAVEVGIVPDEVVLPERQRRLAGIEATAILVGAGDHAELWAADRWGEQAQRPLEAFAQALAG